MPARVLLQDFTGVPCVVDLAAMRAAVARVGGDPSSSTPRSPSTWSSTTRCRSTTSGLTTRTAATSSWRWSATTSGIAPALGAERVSPTCASSPRARGSSTRSTWSTLAAVVQQNAREGELWAYPRHGRGDRLPHHHDQRAGCAGVGSGRHRG